MADGGRERCKTGIAGLDNILNGGIPRGNTILITGSCGTGKTTLSLEFLVHGALMGERSMYISVTEAPEKLLDNMINYEFFDRKLILDKKLIFVDLQEIYVKLGLEKLEFTLEDINILVNQIVKIVKELGIKRLVVDSITSICYRLTSREEIREFILHLGKDLSDMGCTTILISELLPSAAGYSQYGVEEAIADGIILMGNLERQGDLLRTIQVIKMRGTTHSRAKYVLDLTSIGVLIAPLLKSGEMEVK
ncbi:MAG: AAA family ATPase [Euryarchaeota archaeon]|nr:AAA family ATPase [Euryarchaeota archaeon]